MEANLHSMSDLFNQLGLPSRPCDIQAFTELYGPLADPFRLHQAPFWTPWQAAFLEEQFLLDADWIGIIDELDMKLRHPMPSLVWTGKSRFKSEFVQ